MQGNQGRGRDYIPIRNWLPAGKNTQVIVHQIKKREGNFSYGR